MPEEPDEAADEPRTMTSAEIAAAQGITLEEFEAQMAWAKKKPKIVVLPGEGVSSGAMDVRTQRGFIARCEECGPVEPVEGLTQPEARKVAEEHNRSAHKGAGAIDVLGGPKY